MSIQASRDCPCRTPQGIEEEPCETACERFAELTGLPLRAHSAHVVTPAAAAGLTVLDGAPTRAAIVATIAAVATRRHANSLRASMWCSEPSANSLLHYDGAGSTDKVAHPPLLASYVCRPSKYPRYTRFTTPVILPPPALRLMPDQLHKPVLHMIGLIVASLLQVQ